MLIANCQLLIDFGAALRQAQGKQVYIEPKAKWCRGSSYASLLADKEDFRQRRINSAKPAGETGRRFSSLHSIIILRNHGAAERTRTSTFLRTLAPQASLSTSSSTAAFRYLKNWLEAIIKIISILADKSISLPFLSHIPT